MGKKIWILVGMILFGFMSFAFAEEITITTYYPSPHGVYRTLRLYPTDAFTPGGSYTIAGEMFYRATGTGANQVYVCDGTRWVPLGKKTVSFNVNKGGTGQSVPSGSWQAVTWSTERFDTNNNFSSDRFQPSIEGKYLLTANVAMDNLTVGDSDGLVQYNIAIYKNGSLYALGNNQIASANDSYSDPYRSVSVVVDANGTTDYFDVRVFHDSSGGAKNITGSQTATYFSGCLVDS